MRAPYGVFTAGWEGIAGMRVPCKVFMAGWDVTAAIYMEAWGV